VTDQKEIVMPASENKKGPSLWALFITFAKIGAITFGGGLAMLPILQRELVDNRQWTTEEELTDYYAIGQCTPGIIAVNTATFIGQKHRGVAGGIAATAGMVFPSLVIITFIAAFLRNFADNPYVLNAFAGIRVCVTILIARSAIKIAKKSVKDRYTVVLFLLVFAGALLLDVTPVVFVILAAVAGLLIKRMEAKAK
jgi:chromate transporter